MDHSITWRYMDINIQHYAQATSTPTLVSTRSAMPILIVIVTDTSIQRLRAHINLEVIGEYILVITVDISI